MKEVAPYLNFNGNCREAMTFYKKCLGGELNLMPFGDAPIETPAGAKDKIMHSTLQVGNAYIMASDAMPGQATQAGTNVHLSINCESSAEVDKLFKALSENGRVTMPLQDTFWGARFGMVADQFGINWMFNYDKKS